MHRNSEGLKAQVAHLADQHSKKELTTMRYFHQE